MIPRSGLVKLLCLGAATAVVLAAPLLLRPDSHAKIAGGGAPATAELGTRFEDMAAGTLTAQPAPDSAARAVPTALPKTLSATPSAAAPEPLRALTATPPASSPSVAKPSKPAQPLTATEATPLVPQPAPQAERSPLPVLPAQPATRSESPAPTPTPAAAPHATVTAEPTDTPAPVLSKRPELRDPQRAAAAEKARQAPKKATKQKPTRGNAARNNTQGAQTRSQTGTAAKPGARKQAAAPAGNAAASNYPGEVMRRIARAGKPRVGARGTAVIGFAIAANGGLAQIGVARSSGSAALDRAAVALIRKAAPFPRPPAGAQRRFSITIKGR